jgi:hypothetical protein
MKLSNFAFSFDYYQNQLMNQEIFTPTQIIDSFRSLMGIPETYTNPLPTVEHLLVPTVDFGHQVFRAVIVNGAIAGFTDIAEEDVEQD